MTPNTTAAAASTASLRLGTIHVLTVPGRVSGAAHPGLAADGRRPPVVIAGLPQSDWARNVRAAGRGELAHGCHRQRVPLTEVTDPDLRRTVVRAFPTEVPHGVPFCVRIGPVRAGDRVAVFELRAPG